MKGKRTTRQRLQVLEAVRARSDHPTADQIYLDARRADGKISRGTVYRNLAELAAQGEITHARIPGADRYDLRQDQHYHLYCTRCGQVMDAPIAYRPEDSGSRDTLIIEAGEREGIYLADFPIEEMREYRRNEVHGNAYRRPQKYGPLLSEERNEPFIRGDFRK